RYREAAQLFESMLGEGYENGYVRYNLGNAWLRAGELGEAIAAYRRAELLIPGDANLAVNLKRALDRRQQPFSPDAQRALIDYLLFWRGGLPLRTEVQLTLVAAGLAFILAIV